MIGEENKIILMEDSQNQGCHPEGTAWFEFHMELPSETEPFQLEQAVCSHGFFMMAPNHWDPLSKTLTRPLLLHNPSSPSSSSSSLLVSISQRSQSLAVRVHSVHSISPQQQRHITAQISRMLRLSQAEEKAVREFRSVHIDHPNRSFGGRVFRSPTLFEDMVKCILLCNCQWPRTLNMAQALCELQFELQNVLPYDSCYQFPNEGEYFDRTGNFPSPIELANLSESFLAERCRLGYRARYILELAQAIVEGKIQLEELEELSKDASLSCYKQLGEQLKQIKGFGPFTRANVLMCLGYYHVIPWDSETIRHLKQVHSKNTTSKTIESDLEEIYGKYEPYQFLAFWSEIWDFYETRFGKMNEMHSSVYKRITASNMRSTVNATNKRKRPSRKCQC
ncbi:N-glycosylase/DNA lyase [Vigna unguiculata]|uniref:DNA-(apurinic or apyrimidinic site) lyase n=1 Tax=Vigna unguiculata TaxID=3917 RepID=A0A4D6KIS0_VIGUN|nr:N-glycosylase/DNA lyase [Vigna unguiculata]